MYVFNTSWYSAVVVVCVIYQIKYIRHSFILNSLNLDPLISCINYRHLCFLFASRGQLTIENSEMLEL